MDSYTVVLDEGIVIRDNDGKIIAPCQSVDDPDFVAYGAWVNAGNEPTTLDTRG